MNRPRNNRIGRNDPCHCGGGKKFKHCHGALPNNVRVGPTSEEIQLQIDRHKARELQRQQQQGLGRPIIGTKFNEHQVVAVGNTIHWGKWKTMFDFLSPYLKQVLDPEWGNSEIAKPLAERHPILQWYDALCRQQRAAQDADGVVKSAPMTGAMAAYYGLAYNLYLLAHNAELQKRLIGRLKNRDQFRGACYEAFVAGCFVLAGFELKLENEQEGDTTHCEFTATHKVSGKKYSVEAKSRAPNKDNADVGNQLHKALLKRADHTRIVMIDTNLPADSPRSGETWRGEVISAIRGREPKLTVDGTPAPPAYVIVTNIPYNYDLEGINTMRTALVQGFKIPDFGYGATFPSLVEGFKALRRHSDVLAAFEAIRDYRIPMTFDGENPELAFTEGPLRFLVGQRYDLSEIDPGAIGTLEQALVVGDGRTVHLVMRLDDGRRNIYTNTLTEAEAAAYKAHPTTFFGVETSVGGTVETPMDLFEFMYKNYRETPRARILEFFKGAPDLEALSELSDDDLRLTYCERMVWGSGMFNRDGTPVRPANSPTSTAALA